MSEEAQRVDSASDARTANNAVRHQYRVLTEAEKISMTEIKDTGALFLQLLDFMPPSREISIAKTKIEEAVMWAVKGLTA